MSPEIEKYLARIKEIFPDFQGFGQGSDAFDKEERTYKIELVELYKATVAEFLKNFPEDEDGQIEVGKKITALFTNPLQSAGNKPQNLVGFRYYQPFKLEGANNAKWARLVQKLINGEGGLDERINEFVDGLRELIEGKVRKNKVAIAALSRSVTTLLLMLSDPMEHAVIKTQQFNRALKAFNEEPFKNENLSGSEYLRVQKFLHKLHGDLTSAGLTPRDMIDAQSFIWVGDVKSYRTPEQAALLKHAAPDGKQLGLPSEQAELFSHFQGHEDFVQRQPLWTSATTELFDRLVRAVNAMGLDWWFTRATNSQLRFGRKEKDVVRGGPVGLLFLRKDGIRVSWNAFAGLDELESTDLTSELVQLFEAVDKNEGSWPYKLGARSGRNGYWPDDYDIEDEPKNDKLPKNVIYYGPPGTGKTFDLQALLVSDYTDAECGERYEFVTFHQSFGYEEFVEGLRPVITKRGKKRAEDTETASASNGEVRYEIKPGAFLRLCDRARQNPSRQYAMVIDEINRGNISKIFGELITLLEVDKREDAKYPVAVTLPYSAESFSVPSNVDVIGTMNTADRSLAMIDTALRRRFEFIESMPKPSVLAGTIVSHNGVDINIEQMLTMLNMRIEALYDRDHTVGHAYFTRIKDLKDADRFNELRAVFRNKIIPLLEEYFFEDWQKIRLVLGDNQKAKQDHQFVHEIGREEDLLTLFGREHELDQYAIRSRYQLNADALDQPDAYVGIYAAKPAVTTG